MGLRVALRPTLASLAAARFARAPGVPTRARASGPLWDRLPGGGPRSREMDIREMTLRHYNDIGTLLIVSNSNTGRRGWADVRVRMMSKTGGTCACRFTIRPHNPIPNLV